MRVGWRDQSISRRLPRQVNRTCRSRARQTCGQSWGQIGGANVRSARVFAQKSCAPRAIAACPRWYPCETISTARDCVDAFLRAERRRGPPTSEPASAAGGDPSGGTRAGGGPAADRAARGARPGRPWRTRRLGPAACRPHPRVPRSPRRQMRRPARALRVQGEPAREPGAARLPERRQRGRGRRARPLTPLSFSAARDIVARQKSGGDRHALSVRCWPRVAALALAGGAASAHEPVKIRIAWVVPVAQLGVDHLREKGPDAALRQDLRGRAGAFPIDAAR